MVFVLYIIMLIGIARASDMTEHPESLADILTHTHAAGFLDDTHGEAFTDGIGMHTVLYLLQRSSYRDAPAPPCPSHLDVRRPPSLPTPSTPHPPARPANGVRVAGCAEGSRATGRLR